MLYSIAAGIATYYACLALIGVLLNCQAAEGTIIAFAVVCYVGAFCVRSYSNFVHKLAIRLGIITTVLLVVIYFVLPIVTRPAIIWIAVILGIIVYFTTRRILFRRYIRRSDGSIPFPPFGIEWMRWIATFVL